MEYFGSLEGYAQKGPVDLVSVADEAAQALLVGGLQASFPTDAVLAEEEMEGGESKGSPFRWIIDPLDGTTNFVHSFPWFAVSVGLEHDDEIVFGIVFNPAREEFFEATRGQGAFLNGEPIAVSSTETLAESLIASGFPYNRRVILDALLQRLAHALRTCQGFRRMGAAALDLCAVACGRVDGFWEQSLNSWDVAAGALIVEEAGGRTTSFSGGRMELDGGEMIATNGRIHDALQAALFSADGGEDP
jgi:myo-inositol-1(or 4)-monophosphatase